MTVSGSNTPRGGLWSWTAQMHNCGAQFMKVSHAQLHKLWRGLGSGIICYRPRAVKPRPWDAKPRPWQSRLNAKFRPWIERCTRQSRWAQFGVNKQKPHCLLKLKRI